MKRSSDSVGQYHEALKAHHAANPEDERRYHDYVLDSFGLAGAAKQHIMQERNAAAVAHLIRNPEVRAEISKLDDRSQVEALKKIREGENAEPDPDSPEATDNSLGPRATRMAGHARRTGMVR